MAKNHEDLAPEEKRSYTPGYDLRPLEERDEVSLLAGFNEVFSQDNPDFVERSMEEWRWAFRENPAGIRVLVAVKDGEVAAHFASMPVRMWIGGEERLFGQSVDSWVLPEHRKGLRRPGLYAKLVWEFQDLYGAPDRDLLHYGLPVWTAWRIGKRLLSYEVVRTQTLLVKAVPGDADTSVLEGGEVDGLRLERIERFDEQARWLWDRCAGEWGASAIRDDAFLNWRLFDHPRQEYTVLGVRDGEGLLRGYAVFRAGDWIEKGMGLLVDWLVPSGEEAVAALLMQGLLALGVQAGTPTLTAIFPDWSNWFESFQELDWRVYPSDYFMIGVNYNKHYDMRWLREKWWYQLIDTDLV